MLRASPGVLTCLAFAAALAASAPTPAAGFCRTTTSFSQPDPTRCPPPRGIPIAWPGGCAALSIDPTLLADGITRDQFRAEVDTAMRLWSEAPCPGGGVPSFHFVPYGDCAQRGEWNPMGTNTNSVAFRPVWDDDAFHPPDAIAVTVTTFARDSGAIRDADTELNLRGPTNPQGFLFTVGAPDPSAADLPTILLHELGHAQGLAHSDVSGAVMWFSAGRGEQRRALTADDTAGICTIYPPTRNAACQPAPVGGFACPQTGCTCDPGDAGVPCDGAPQTVSGACVDPRRRTGCGCDATPAREGGARAGAIGLALALVVARRRRRG